MRTLYRLLLRLYPSSFRVEYEAELLRTFEETHGGRHPVVQAFAAIADVVPNACSAHGAILAQDLRSAFRTIQHSRGFALTVVLVTALGVGANTATFSVTDFVLFRPLPYPQPEALVRICEGPPEGGGWGCMNEISPANLRDVVQMTSSFESIGGFTATSVNLAGTGEPVRLPTTLISPQAFGVLRVPALLGRVFDATDTTGETSSSVILSHGLWQSHFGGDHRVVGSTVRIDGAPRVVIGVMPPSFRFPSPDVQVWLPLMLTEAQYENRQNTYLQAIARLGPGVTFEQARADLARAFEQLRRDYPEANEETGFSFFRQRDVLPRNRMMLLALCGASLCLLLLTAANLANLFLARAANRERELAVRAALGAGRSRLVRQMLTESIVLSLLGGVAGIAVAAGSMPLLVHIVPTSLPFADQPQLDLRVLGVAATFAALTGIGFGLLPALRVGRQSGLDALRDSSRTGGGRRQRMRTVLVAVEVTLSVVLLVSTGLLIRAVMRVQAVEPGFAAEQVMTFRTDLSSARYEEPASKEAFYQEVIARVRALPGVEAVAYTSGIPMVLTGGITGVEVPGREELNRRRQFGVSWRVITPDFFEALGVPLVAGRAFTDGDMEGRQLAAIVSESFVQRYWPGEDGIGKMFRFRDEERTIVGVARDIRVRGLERESEPQVYFPSMQMIRPLGGLYIPKDLLVRARGDVASMVPLVRDIVRRVDPEQPVSNIRLLSEVVSDQTSTRRSQLYVLGALAFVALLLTGVGIHGLLAYMVAQRAQEIGVRLALGAAPADVARMIVGEAGRLALWGAVPGFLLAYGAAQAMRALLFGIEPADPATIVGGVVIVTVVTIAGALVPALRAVRVSPLLAMRAG